MNKIFAALGCLALGCVNLPAQTPPKPASNDPMAGLNLSDPTAPPASPTAPASTIATPSAYVGQLKGLLVSMVNGKLQPFDAATLSKVQYFAFYKSASWCPPCRTFTPQLVDFYESFKRSHPNFELILVCTDRSEEDMEAYMSDDNMTWPALKFGDRPEFRPTMKRFFGNAIPDLVLTDGNGKILSSTFVDGKHTDPAHVMDDIEKMVPRPSGT